MLSAREQETLTKVGPDSECGAWLRSFWFKLIETQMGTHAHTSTQKYPRPPRMNRRIS